MGVGSGEGSTGKYELEWSLREGLRAAEIRVHEGEGLNGGCLILTEYYGMKFNKTLRLVLPFKFKKSRFSWLNTNQVIE